MNESLALTISWGIVAVIVSLFVDWKSLIVDGWRGLVQVWSQALQLMFSPIITYIKLYRQPPGRHRKGVVREPVTVSEVDRWRGADEEFVTILHTLNRQLHMNDQARA